MNRAVLACVLAALSASLLAETPAADPVGLRGDIGGLWYTPTHDGQGLQIDVLDRGRAVVTWYTFDSQGRPLWLAGVGQIDGAAVQIDVSSASGGRFATAPPQAPQLQTRGQLNITFSGCNEASLEFDSADAELASGSLALSRLSAPDGARCNADEEFAEQRRFSFEHGAGAFTPLFADLPAEPGDVYELDFDYETLPTPLQARRGLRLSGHNRSDDLAMLITAPLLGLAPNQLYRIELDLELASDVPAGCAGVGGAPGESVYIKLGASDIEPQAVAADEGGTSYRRLNIDYGIQSNSGAQALVVGDMSTDQQCESSDGAWQLKTLSTRGRAFRARSDADGRLWILAGTDSAFEGRTDVYFTALTVRLQPVAASE